MTSETQSAPVAERGERTILTGKVTSAKMEKTIVVEVQRLVQHPKYRRVVRISKKFYAHDENRQAKPGDTVRIVASRPLSKLKRWRLKEVLTRNASAKALPTKPLTAADRDAVEKELPFLSKKDRGADQ
jgi:small subunit ribosomal protein S17